MVFWYNNFAIISFKLGFLILISAPQRYPYILEGNATKELLRWRIDPVAHLSSLWDGGYLTLVVLHPQTIHTQWEEAFSL